MFNWCEGLTKGGKDSELIWLIGLLESPSLSLKTNSPFLVVPTLLMVYKKELIAFCNLEYLQLTPTTICAVGELLAFCWKFWTSNCFWYFSGKLFLDASFEACKKLIESVFLYFHRTENMARKAAGEEPLPEEDPSNPIFKPIAEPSRLESFLITNQISNFCNQINGYVSSDLCGWLRFFIFWFIDWAYFPSARKGNKNHKEICVAIWEFQCFFTPCRYLMWIILSASWVLSFLFWFCSLSKELLVTIS